MSIIRRSLVAVVPLLIVALAKTPAQQRAPDDKSQDDAGRDAQTDAVPTPRFRVEANFVRVDVYPTVNGVAVRDLQATDFEVLEDGKPQKIETFEHVEVQGGGPQQTRVEPQTVAEGRAALDDPRARVFVIFLDTYHTDVAASHRTQRAIANLLDKLLGQDDVFAVMTPEMSPRDLAFARRTGTTIGMLQKYWTWGREDSIVDYDPEEQGYLTCYPPKPAPDLPGGCKSSDYVGVAYEMIARRREVRTLSALEDLAIFLRDVREERKAVVAITSGWVLYRPNLRLGRKLDCDPVPGRSQVGVDPSGRLRTDPRSHENVSRYSCDKDRINLAQLDNNKYFLDILDRANRSNVSFYPIDMQGLRAWNSDLGGEPPGAPPFVDAATDRALLMGRLQTIRTLAEATDGLAVVDTNDFNGGMKRIVDDLSSYYLLGYYSSNAKLDGKFRSIKVRVTRPGVQVRARRGYRALTKEELENSRELTETAAETAPPNAVQTALASLSGVRRGTRLSTQISWVAAPIEGPADAKSHLWIVGEVDSATARSSEWAAGGEAELVVTAEDEATIATANQPIPPGARIISLTVPDVALGPGDYVARLRLRPSAPGIPLVDTLRFTVADEGTAVGRARLRRRGRTTGMEYVVTATPTFQRTERLRIEVPVLGAADKVSAELLDRNGKPIPVPVETSVKPENGGGLQWATAELALAPLAVGDYVVRTTVERGDTRHELVTAFKVVP